MRKITLPRHNISLVELIKEYSNFMSKLVLFHTIPEIIEILLKLERNVSFIIMSPI